MDALHVILFCGASAALALLVFAVRCLRRSWRALLHRWYPHTPAPSDPMPLADQLQYFWYGISLLIAAWFVAYWTFVIWGLSRV